MSSIPPPPPPPSKTELGQDELRLRTRKLSQRHRTVLLLVDGKRSETEVVDLARQAGVAPSVFGELVDLGMIDAPAPRRSASLAPATPAGPSALATPRPAEPPAQAETAVGAVASAADESGTSDVPGEPEDSEGLDEPDLRIETLSVEVSATEAPAPAAPPALQPVPAARLVRGSEAGPSAVAPAELAPVSAPIPLAAAEAVRPARVKFSAPVLGRPPAAASESPPPPPPPPPPMAPPRAAPDALLDADRFAAAEAIDDEVPTVAADDAEGVTEDALVVEVRGLLVGTLLIDGPVSSSLLALRARRARTRGELIRLVWEIERSMVRARRPRESQARLARARDLLGLGNTVVFGDSAASLDGDHLQHGHE